MPTLYDEAIADAKELVRMAEENATNRLIEAVAPRIRKIVEKRLTETTNEDDDIDSIVASLDTSGEEEEEMEDMPADDAGEMDDLEGEEEDEFEDEEDEEFDMDSFSSAGGMASFPMKGVKKINIEFEGDKMLTDEGVELTNESINTLLGIIDGKGSLKDRIREARMELKLIGRALGALNEGRTGRTAALRIVENFNNILRKSLGFQGELNDIPRGTLRESSSSEMNLLLKEIKIMSTRSLLRTLLEREEAKTRSASRRRTLREADEDEDEAAADDEGGGDEGGDDEGGDEGGDVDVDAVKSAIESLAAAVGMEVKASDEGGDEGGDDEGGDEEISLEADEGVYEMDMDEEMDEMDEEMEGMHMESRRRGARRETVFTVNESQLRQELQRLRARRLREEIEPTSAFGGEPEEEFSSYDDVELNANVSEADAPKAKKEADKAKKEADKAKAEAADAKKEAMEEARKNRALTGRLQEATAAINELRRELNEQKLFNAKLLYVNKLMQNAALPQSKLKAVVEALDSAKTLREANLLYKSLNESLSRTSGSLSEGANRTVGSSSRSTRPGGMVNESVGETDRWAVLAGIGTKA